MAAVCGQCISGNWQLITPASTYNPPSFLQSGPKSLYRVATYNPPSFLQSGLIRRGYKLLIATDTLRRCLWLPLTTRTAAEMRRYRKSGAVCKAVDEVLGGSADNAFCAIRPPGHHAEPNRSMGFCIFNNVAGGAKHAQVVHGIERVAVVDFDVHHGNGTQEIFWNDANLFLASTHQMPLYPGTGNPDEQGVNDNIVNVPLSPYSGSDEFRSAMVNRVFPSLRKFEPELLLISSGFDGHTEDPLAQLNLVEEDYAWITNELMNFASDYCGGRVVSALEGGYNLDALSRCVAAHVRVMMRT